MHSKKYISFVGSNHNAAFLLPDGGRIRLTYPHGEQVDYACHFISDSHVSIGGNIYHIYEFAEYLEYTSTKCKPLDYIQEPELYPKRFLPQDENGNRPPYFIIDETTYHGLAYAPKGAAKGRKYAIFEKDFNRDGDKDYRIGSIVRWSGTLKELQPESWRFNMTKVKAVTQRSKKRPVPKK